MSEAQQNKRHPYDANYYLRRYPNAYEPVGIAFYRYVAQQLVNRLNPEIVLDVGCGLGNLPYAFRQLGVKAFGVDISKAAIGDKLEDGFALCDIDNEQLPFKDNTFDLITAIEVVEHLYNPEHFISEARRVLKPGSFVFITSPGPLSIPHPKFWQLVWRLVGRGEETHVGVHSARWWRSYFELYSFKYSGSLSQEFAAYRMNHGFYWLPPPERFLFRMGMMGRYIVTRVHSLFSANLLFQRLHTT